MTYIPLTGASSGGSKPSNWTVRERLRNITKALTAGSSLDLRFAEKFFYQNDALYPAMELMATHSRTSSAWYPNWDFKSGSEVGRLVEYGADGRRYGDYGALDEGASTNHIRNPRCEGTQTGPLDAGGVLPDHWASAGLVAAEWTFVGSGVEQGWPYAELSYSGSDNAVDIYFEGTTAFGVLTGQSMASSVGVRLVSGSLANTGIAIRSQDLNSGGGQLSVTNTSIAVDTEHRRFAQLRTTAGGGTQTNARFGLQFTNSAAANFTVRIYTPQLEQAATPTSPILPTAGTPAAATRAADVVTGVTTDRASRGWYDTQWDYTNGGECGDLLEFLPGVPRVGPKGLLVEEGTTNLWTNPRFDSGSPVSFLQGAEQDLLVSSSSGYENGWPYAELHFQKANPTGGSVVVFWTTGGAPSPTVSANSMVTVSAGARIVEGDASGLGTFRPIAANLNVGGSFNRNASGLDQGDALDGVHRRFWQSYQLENGEDSLSIKAEFGSRAGVPLDVKVRIYLIQVEQKAYPTSVVLPEAGSPAAATRAADDIERENGDWASDTAFSVFGEFVLNTVAQDGSPFSIASGGSDRTDILACEGGDLKFRYRSNGVTDASQIIRSAQAAETVRSAIGVDASEVAVSVSGAATQTYTPTDVLPGASLSFGKAWPSAATAGSFFIKSARYWPYRFSNSELEALVA